MKTYELTVKHDNGEVTIRVRARNVEMAHQMVENAEGCPRSAIYTWRIVPTKKQIQRTKNLLRGI